jgi:glucokinase
MGKRTRLMDKKGLIIGVDIGATFVKTGLLDVNGHIVTKSLFQSKGYASRDRLIDRIVFEVKEIARSSRLRVSGLGVGVPGPVDYKKGVVYNLTNIKGWRDCPLRYILREKTGMPVFIDNDANAACAGEARWGAGRGYKDIVCVTLGSGVGTAVMINGDIYRGRGYSAVEMGHICIDRNGPRCNCGANGCIETFLGNSYIVSSVVRALRQGKRSILSRLAKGRYSDITPKLIDRAARTGDKFCVDIWRQAGENLGIGLAGIVNTFNPEIIIIGGGLSRAGKLLFDPVRDTVKERAIKIFSKGLRIKRARFIEDAGTVGAAALALDEHD